MSATGNCALGLFGIGPSAEPVLTPQASKRFHSMPFLTFILMTLSVPQRTTKAL